MTAAGDGSAAADALSDDDFISAVREGRLTGGFRHRDHVRAAWILIRRQGIGGGGDALADMVRGVADAAGAPQKFHKTVTWAFVLMVAEAIDADPAVDSWPVFAATNPKLLAWPNPALTALWGTDILTSEDARTRLVLPTPG